MGPASHEGSVYIVAGSSGKTGGGSLNHPAMFTSLDVLGSLVLDVDGNRLDVTFVDDNGATLDYFTLLKGDDQSLPVELTSFGAIAADGEVTLRWNTASEINNLGFVILRTSDIDAPYEEIQSYMNNDDLKGAGTSSHSTDYIFVDKQLLNGTTYWYKLVDIDLSGVRTEHGPIHSTPHSALPKNFALYQNKPNPFNPSTIIKFDIPALREGVIQISLSVFNLLGQKIVTPFDGVVDAGTYEVKWNGLDQSGNQAPSGVYIYQLISEKFSQSKRMTLVK